MEKSLTSQILGLKVGEEVVTDLAKCCSARAIASTLGLRWDRVYVTKTDRASRTITIRRQK